MSADNEAWYFIFTLGGRQPVQFGPYVSETDCLTAIIAMQPVITPSKPQECLFYHWKSFSVPVVKRVVTFFESSSTATDLVNWTNAVNAWLVANPTVIIHEITMQVQSNIYGKVVYTP